MCVESRIINELKSKISRDDLFLWEYLLSLWNLSEKFDYHNESEPTKDSRNMSERRLKDDTGTVDSNEFNKIDKSTVNQSNNAFLMAWIGMHSKTVEFLIKNDSSNILLKEEDIHLLFSWGLKAWLNAVNAKIKIERQKISILKSVFNQLRKCDIKVRLFI